MLMVSEDDGDTVFRCAVRDAKEMITVSEEIYVGVKHTEIKKEIVPIPKMDSDLFLGAEPKAMKRLEAETAEL